MSVDLSQLSTSDLQALRNGDLSKVSTKGLLALRMDQSAGSTHNAGVSGLPEPTSVMDRVLQGWADPAYGLGQMVYNTLPESVQGGLDAVDRWGRENVPWAMSSSISPTGNFNETVANREKSYVAPEGTDIARMVGNLGGALTLGGKLPVGSTLPRALALGAGSGALIGASSPVSDPHADFWQQKADEATMGGLMGAALGPLGHILGSRLEATLNRPDVAALRAEGIQPTTGQLLGPMANKVEESLVSVPFLGSSITAARQGAMDQFGSASIQMALRPLRSIDDNFAARINNLAGKTGQDAVLDAKNILNDAYAHAAEGIGSFNVLNPGFMNTWAKVNADTHSIAPLVNNRINSYLDRLFQGTKNGVMPASHFKVVDSDLGNKIQKFTKSPNADDSLLADALRQIQQSLRDTVAQSNPEYAGILRSADESYKQWLAVNNAAQSSLANEGAFTPGQLIAGAKRADRTARKVGLYEDPMVNFGQAAQNVLGNKLPNSGTAERLMTGGGALGAGAGLGVSPWWLATIPAGVAAYSRAGQTLLNGAISGLPYIGMPFEQAWRGILYSIMNEEHARYAEEQINNIGKGIIQP